MALAGSDNTSNTAALSISSEHLQADAHISINAKLKTSHRNGIVAMLPKPWAIK